VFSAFTVITVNTLLAPFYKQNQVNINKAHVQHDIVLYIKIVDPTYFGSESFKENIIKFTSPNVKLNPAITKQTQTIKSQYSTITNLLLLQNKYLNEDILFSPENQCQIETNVFLDSYAKRLTEELHLLQADLPALSPNLKDDEITLQAVSGILMQVILDLQIIITSLYEELQELEAYVNLQTTKTTYFLIQNSSCLNPELHEHIAVNNVQPSKSGLIINLKVVQFQPTNNAFTLIATNYFQNQVNLKNTFLISEQLETCNCLYNKNQVYTGCQCSKYNPNCAAALNENNIKNIIYNCEWIPSISHFPQPTLNGMLFSTYVPYTLKGTSLETLNPNQDYSLPFHVVSSNQFKISYKNVELIYQTQKKLDAETIEILDTDQDTIDLLENTFQDLTWPDIVTYLSLTLAGSATFTMVATIIGFYVKKQNYKAPYSSKQRRPVTLTFQPISM